MTSTYIAPPKSVVAAANLPWLEWMAESAPAGGCFVEFGVYLGGSAWYLAKVARQQGRRLYLYDTFTGMPFADAIDPHPKGCFADTSLAMVKEKIPDAIYCVGVFPETLVAMPPIAFAHIDCDQYRSCHDAWKYFAPLMMPGGIMVFDDYPVVEGARVAVEEFAKDRVTVEMTKGVIRF